MPARTGKMPALPQSASRQILTKQNNKAPTALYLAFSSFLRFLSGLGRVAGDGINGLRFGGLWSVAGG